MSIALVYGVGKNDLQSSHDCPFYSRWKGLLRRCYTQREGPHRHYDGCRISAEWLTFSEFKEWMERQPWDGYQLDKDILRPWEKLYCEETSVFVPQFINTLAIDVTAFCSDLPPGVSRSPRGKPFLARVRWIDGRRKSVGSYSSADEAHRAWAAAKAAVIEHAVDKYRETDRHDDRVCEALLSTASKLKSA